MVCPVCRKPRTGECDVRIEFRRLSNYERLRVVGLGHMCAACAIDLASLLRDLPSRKEVFTRLLDLAERNRSRRDAQGALL